MNIIELDNDIKLKLLGGLPMVINKVGKVHPITIREISDIGETQFNMLMSLLCFDKSQLPNEKGIDLDEVKNFDILAGNCMYDEQMKEDMELILTLLFKETVTFIPKYLVFLVGEDYKKPRLLNRDNYDELVNILKIQNNIKNNVTKKPKKMSKKMEMLMKKRQQGRQLMAKARGQDDVSLSDLVSVLAVFLGDINKIYEMTLYQFYDQYERFMKKENYERNFSMFLVGADPKKLKLDIHWTSKLKLTDENKDNAKVDKNNNKI